MEAGQNRMIFTKFAHSDEIKEINRNVFLQNENIPWFPGNPPLQHIQPALHTGINNPFRALTNPYEQPLNTSHSFPQENIIDRRNTQRGG